MPVHDIDDATRTNQDYRHVLATAESSQLVLMSLEPGQEIGEEVHDDVDQTLVVVAGQADAVLDGETTPVVPGQLVFVPAGTRHNIVARGRSPLKLWTLYAPPEHPDGTVHHTKAEADVYEAEHH